MLGTISILTALAFAAIYPLCFWISHSDPLKNNFHKFHLGLPNTIGGVVLIFIWVLDYPLDLKIIVTVWKAVFISISNYSWKKQYPDPRLITIPCLMGIYAFLRIQSHLIGPEWTTAIAGILGGAIFCASIFAMNLGHWYLNVHGLPIEHLMRSVLVFWVLLATRFLWDAVILLTGKVFYSGEMVPLLQFSARSDGFLLWTAVFFGTLFPIIALYFVKEVIKLKNTQSATGILYVVLCSVLLGDIAYKYFLIKFGITM